MGVLKLSCLVCILLGLSACCTYNGRTIGFSYEKEFEFKIGSDEIGHFADSTFENGDDLEHFVDAKLIKDSNVVEVVSIHKAIEVYGEYKSSSNKSQSQPIFEVKKSNKAIVCVKGQGLWGPIWANILIDRSTLKIQKIAFDHSSETPNLGAEITKDLFEQQFEGIEITFKPNAFGLNQDGIAKIEGDYEIDGISGATITGQGVVNMLNKGLLPYRKYLSKH